MKLTRAFIVFLLLVAPASAIAQERHERHAANVNSRYSVESVSLAGVSDSEVSRSVRADMRRLVGQNYDQGAVNEIAVRMRKELRDYAVDVKVRRGNDPEHVKVTFEAKKSRNRRFDVHLPPILYASHEGWSGALDLTADSHNNYFTFGLLSTSDELLERNAGYRLRYEHRRVGTDVVQVGVEWDAYHQTFEEPTLTALASAAGIPGVYRRRQNFAPSVSILPVDAFKLTFGVSLQTLDFDRPAVHSERAYAFTFDAQLRQRVGTVRGFRQTFSADYSLRKATSSLHSDFTYTRHLATADYTLSHGRHLFGLHGRGGDIEGDAPLFERFSLGNSFALRGWNKFDVAPLGGSRVAFGSVEYRYRPFQIFYDVGSVWDRNDTVTLRHSIGVGLVSREGAFFTLAFPVRQHDVSPVVMFGFRY